MNIKKYKNYSELILKKNHFKNPQISRFQLRAKPSHEKNAINQKCLKKSRTTVALLTLMSLILTNILGVDGQQNNNFNRPPQFILNDGQSEIVLRLKEGPATPPGSLIYKLKGYDPDGDKLTFGIKGQTANELLRVENLGTDEANIYLRKELDREVEDEYMLVVTLTDSRLSDGSFVTQSLLILVEDLNDNPPVFQPYQSTIKVSENSPTPKVLTTIFATDRDDGIYGQVVYKLEAEKGDEGLFSISTVNGRGVLKLISPLDYEKKFLYQLKVLAVDRANSNTQINSATAAILVQVEDQEDSNPEFTQVPPVTRIREDISKGSFVLQVTAVDGDRGVNNEISYSLLNENDVFGVDSQSGIVFTKSILDREDASGGSYILQIVATEQSQIRPRPSVSTEVTVIITDVNDESPNFKSRFYVAEVVENSPVDVPLTFLGDSIPECYDHDLGINGTFLLSTSGDGGLFEVTPNRGINQVSFLIRVKNPARLDYEKLQVINFTLIAEELNGEKRSTVPVTVYIRDTNDNIPEWEKEKYQVDVDENSPPGTTILQVKATDKDSGPFGTSGIRYTSISGSLANELNLDPISGIITTKQVENSLFDRELSSVYYLTVEARDNNGKGNRNNVQVRLDLQDLNDLSPVFLQPRYEARLEENEQEFVTPLIIQARDLDLKGTENALVHYSIVTDSMNDYFEIDHLTGRVKVTRSIDFESIPAPKHSPRSNVKKLNFTVKAQDLGSPPKFSYVPVTIFVTDRNDFSPVFEKDYYQKTIREDSVGNTLILRVKATDRDDSSPYNRVFYRIEKGAQDKFIIESETGVLRLVPGATLDYNIKPFHILTITAIDGGGNFSEKPTLVNVTISDVNNKNPYFMTESPFLNLSQENNGGKKSSSGTQFYNSGIFHAKIAENSPKGKAITQVKASDPDSNAILKYSINFNESEARGENGRLLRGIDLSKMFNLSSSDGILRVGGKIDREIVESVKFQIIVEDMAAENGQRQLAQTTLILSIIDENDNDPVWLISGDDFFASIQENAKIGSSILTVSAEDPDSEKSIKYSLIGKNLPIRIDPESGVVSVSGKIDRETMGDWINATVLAEDSHQVTKRKVSKKIQIRVLDENDNSPYFVDSYKVSNITVREDAAIGTIIAKLKAYDNDTGEYGKITYLLDRKSSLGKFSIDPETGYLRVSEKLDREEISVFSLLIQAYDNFRFGYSSGDSRNTVMYITVVILDTNDETPVLEIDTLPGLCTSITEFHEELITTVRARDGDDPESVNSQVSFRIKKGNELGLFKLEPGKNYARILPGRSLKGFYGNYTLVIEGSDGGRPPNAAVIDAKICVTDYNDNNPRFINPPQNFTIRVPENATLGTTIIQVRAVDNDIGQNGVVRYRFRKDVSGHSDTFNINPTTGVISLAKYLDREQQKIYHLRVEAYDLGIPTPLSTDLDLTVLVRNIDDFRPQFEIEEFVITFNENADPGRENAELPQTLDRDDEDEDEDRKSAGVCYFILPDHQNSSSIFSLNPLTHVLTTRVRLDREKFANHTLTVKATEDCQRGSRISLLADIKSSHDRTFLKVIVKVQDENDNKPKFTQKIFTGGISTSTDYGTEFMRVRAIDEDSAENAQLKYFIVHPIKMSLTEGLSHLAPSAPLFEINRITGAISLAFDPQPDMKGHFELDIRVNDTHGLSDQTKALVYLLRDDQKVKVTVRMSPVEVRESVDIFTKTLSNVTGMLVNVDENFKYHENKDGSVDKTKTDFYIHLVHPEKNLVMDVIQVLKLMDLNVEELDPLFKDFNVLDTQANVLGPLVGGSGVFSSGHGSRGVSDEKRNLILVYAAGCALFFGLLLVVVISLCIAMRAKYQRQLKAATAAYGSNSTIIPRPANVPNTNVHSVEGSNPIWMQAYHNNWYKEDSISDNSETRDSLDENAIQTESSASPPSSHLRSFVGSGSETSRRNDLNNTTTYHKNLQIYNNNRNHLDSSNLILKKHLETTEL